MTYDECFCLVKSNCSRGVLMGGFGCLEFYVPEKSVAAVEQLLKEELPVCTTWSVNSLKSNKIKMKKGDYRTGILNIDNRDEFFSICKEFFPPKRGD